LYICSLWYRHSVKSEYLDDWLTVHRSVTLVDLQLDAQNSYLFTHNTFIKILYRFLQQSPAMHFTTLAIFLRLSLPWKRPNVMPAGQFPFPMLINFILHLNASRVTKRTRFASKATVSGAFSVSPFQKSQIQSSFVRL
jgi:hypothetical protein